MLRMDIHDTQIRKTVKVYDDYAGQFANYAEAVLPQYHLNKFISLLKGKRILDLGCGSGRDVRYFMDMGLKPVGADISEGILAEASKRGKAEYCRMDMAAICFRDGCFDGIWAIASLLHARKKNAPGILQEAGRALKKNGILYLGLKEGNGEIFRASKSVPGKAKFYALYTQPEIEQLLEENGFEILSSTSELSKPENLISIYARKK